MERGSAVVAAAGLDLDEAALGQEVGGEVAAHAAGGVEADGPLQFVDVGARGVAVNDEGRAVPAVGPEASIGALGALAGAALGIDDLDTRDDGGGLAGPGLAGEEAAVDEDGVELGDLVGEGHLLEVGPVLGAELVEGGLVVFLEQGAVAGAAVVEEAGLVVAEQGEGAVLEGEVDDAGAVGAAVHEIAEEDEPVVAGEGEALEEFGEFEVTPVDVTDGDDATVHAWGVEIVLASSAEERKQQRPPMELTLQSLASRCHQTGRSFAEGERVSSYLVRDRAQADAVVRLDVAATAEAEFMTPGPVVCRWVQVFKARKTEANPERTLKLTAETLFLALSDPANERTPENERLLQVLALMLERKRVLRPKGRSADRRRLVYEHAKLHSLHEVEAAELSPEFFLSIQEQLALLVGGGGGGATAKPEVAGDGAGGAGGVGGAAAEEGGAGAKPDAVG